MKPQELRIGNYVNFKDRNDILFCEVIGIDKSGYIHVVRNFNDSIQDDQPEVINDITPIRLTEEWLIKFGFEKIVNTPIAPIWDENIEYSYEGYRFAQDMYGKWFLLGYSWNTNHFGYVHQLQNLYFTLTGEELIIKKS